MENDFLTVKQIAEKLQVKTFTVLEWIRSGELPAYRIGKREYRVKVKDFEQYLKDRRVDKQDS